MKLTATALLLSLGTICSAADRALVIGVGNYRDAAVPRLPGIERDVNNEVTSLQRLGFRESEIHKLLDSKATLENIRSEIRTWLAQAKSPNDRVVFYFSGHGSLSRDTKNQEVAVLVPYDTSFGPNRLINALEGPELGRLLSAVGTRNVLIVADACHSGHMTDARKGLEVVPKFLQYPGMPTGDSLFDVKGITTERRMNHILLSACRKEETAGATHGGSILTVAFIASVEQFTGQNKPVTLKSLLSDITGKLTGAAQHPELSGDDDLKLFNWARAREPQAPPVQIDPPPPPTNTSEWWGALRTFYATRNGDVALKLSRDTFRNGETMSMWIDVPGEGYLNVVAMGDRDTEPTVLFPNQFAQNNHVTGGQLKLPASSTYIYSQESDHDEYDEVLVIFSPTPINMYTEGTGKDVFRKLSPNFRSTVVRPGTGYQAALADYRIAKK